MQPSATDWMSAVASVFGALVGIVALVAIFGFRKQIALHSRQLKLDLENVYVARYWQVMDDLAASGDDEAESRHIDRYLKLAEDQCDLRARRRITKSTWLYWKAGIVDQLIEERFSNVVHDTPSRNLQHIRKLQGDSDYDPPRTRTSN